MSLKPTNNEAGRKKTQPNPTDLALLTTSLAMNKFAAQNSENLFK